MFLPDGKNIYDKNIIVMFLKLVIATFSGVSTHHHIISTVPRLQVIAFLS